MLRNETDPPHEQQQDSLLTELLSQALAWNKTTKLLAGTHYVGTKTIFLKSLIYVVQVPQCTKDTRDVLLFLTRHKSTSFRFNAKQLYSLTPTASVYFSDTINFINVLENTEESASTLRVVFDQHANQFNQAVLSAIPYKITTPQLKHYYIFLSHSLQNRLRTKDRFSAPTTRKEVLGKFVGRGNGQVFETLPLDASFKIIPGDSKRVTKIDTASHANPLGREIKELGIKEDVHGSAGSSNFIFITMKRFDCDFYKFMCAVHAGEYAISEETYLLVPSHLAFAIHNQLTERRLVHRDLKPANIMVNKNPLRFVVTDIQTIKKRETDDQGRLYTTPEYATSQVLQGNNTTDDTDVYALLRMIAEWFKARPVPYDAKKSIKERMITVLYILSKDAYLNDLFRDDKIKLPEVIKDKISHFLKDGLNPDIKQRKQTAYSVGTFFFELAREYQRETNHDHNPAIEPLANTHAPLSPNPYSN